MSKKHWIHKKYPGTKFKGSYSELILRSGKKERVFLLEGTNSKNKTHVVSFESWQAARKAEWVRGE